MIEPSRPQGKAPRQATASRLSHRHRYYLPFVFHVNHWSVVVFAFALYVFSCNTGQFNKEG
jgi:hypothetical protein